MSFLNTKPGFEAWAFRDINDLIKGAENIRNTLKLEKFQEKSDTDHRVSIEEWLIAAGSKITFLATNPNDAEPFRVDTLADELAARFVSAPSSRQYGELFSDFLATRITILYEMRGIRPATTVATL